MAKPGTRTKDRRRDQAQRLRYAVRKAHDRLFSILRTPEKTPGLPTIPKG